MSGPKPMGCADGPGSGTLAGCGGTRRHTAAAGVRAGKGSRPRGSPSGPVGCYSLTPSLAYPLTRILAHSLCENSLSTGTPTLWRAREAQSRWKNSST